MKTIRKIQAIALVALGLFGAVACSENSSNPVADTSTTQVSADMSISNGAFVPTQTGATNPTEFGATTQASAAYSVLRDSSKPGPGRDNKKIGRGMLPLNCLSLTDAQKAQVDSFIVEMNASLLTAREALNQATADLRAQDSALVAAWKVGEDARRAELRALFQQDSAARAGILAQLKAGTIDRKTADSLMKEQRKALKPQLDAIMAASRDARKQLEEARKPILDQIKAAVQVYAQAEKAALQTLLANIRTILTPEQIQILDNWAAGKRPKCP